MATVINVNGRIAQGTDATIPVLDHGFLYGEGVYEVCRTYHGYPFLFDRHLRRLRATYRRRRDEFVDRLVAAAPRVRVEGVAAGLHALVGWPPGVTEAAVMAAAEARGIGLTPLAPGWHGEPRGEGVMVGYGRPPAHDLRRCYGAFAALMADITR